MSLVLRNIDTNNEMKLEKGVPLVIGRTDVGCSDKRVSRKHSQLLNDNGNSLQILALHTNPCFIMRKGLPPILQLKKDEEQILNEGDYFGLLPDAFWFEIVIKTASSKDDHKANENSLQKVDSDDDKTELKPIIAACQNSPSTSIPHDSPGTSTESKVPKMEVSESHESGGSKIPPELEKTRKLPLWMYEIDEPKETKTSPAKRPHSLGVEQSGGKKAKTERLSSPGKTSTSRNQVNVPAASPQNENKISADKPKTENVNVNVNLSQPSPMKKDEKNMEGESSKQDEENGKDGYESDAAEPEEPAGNSNPLRRPVCQYEGSCYRKNPQHKQEYCHPGDADYVRPENRPVCPYGASCYRQNQMHRVEYQHPTSTPAPRPQPQSPASPASPPLPPKRKRKTKSPQPHSSEEDEYDLDDPFLNDASSDDYAPTDSDSDEDEEEASDLSQTEKENLRRLKKEAKKIMKKKK